LATRLNNSEDGCRRLGKFKKNVSTMQWLFIGVLIATLSLIESFERPVKCEPVTVPLCKTSGQFHKYERMYNETVYPNILGHRNQEEAGLEVSQFSPLVRVNCSQYLRLFLCTVYVPMCSSPVIRPCRSLCEGVRGGCLPLMQKFGFKWPESLKCEKYPRKTDGICFGGPNNQVEEVTDKEKTCKDCLDNTVDAEKLKTLCNQHDLVLVGKVLTIRGDRRVKFRVKQEIKVKKNIGRLIKKRLRQKKMMVKLSFPKKACVGKCKNFEKAKTYVVFLKIKKGKRAVYNQAGVVLYQRGMKIC